jgi:hypothetical protein
VTTSERWEELSARYARADSQRRREEIAAEMRLLFDHVGEHPEHTEWLADALTDPNRRWFVFAALRQAPQQVVAPLFDRLIRAAVYETNPSYNRWFVEPCVHGVGGEKTIEALLRYFREGSDFEKAGAVNALYWARLFPPTQQLRRLFLEEFVRNSNIDVRRSLVATLTFDPGDYPREERELALEARRIALSHTDEYIRGRAQGDIRGRKGKLVLYARLPHRRPSGADWLGDEV